MTDDDPFDVWVRTPTTLTFDEWMADRAQRGDEVAPYVKPWSDFASEEQERQRMFRESLARITPGSIIYYGGR